MQDIPRNELLDKLDAGWKVRRNNWAKGAYIHHADSSTSCHWFDLIKDDWEGEPAAPKLNFGNCHITFAFDELINHKAGFIRRASWNPNYICIFDAYRSADIQTYELSAEDILAKDWEVWG